MSPNRGINTRGRVAKVSITEINDKGVGFGFTKSGTHIYVPGTLVGEVVKYRELHKGQTGTIYGELHELLVASPDRVPSRCPKFLICGGCDFLHAASEAELAFKRQRVASALNLPQTSVDSVISSPQKYYYRAVAKWVIGSDGTLGSYAPRSHQVVDMQGCIVHVPVLEDIAQKVRKVLASPSLSKESLRYLVLRAAVPERRVHATLVMSQKVCPAEKALRLVLSAMPEVIELWLHINDAQSDAIFIPNGETFCVHRREQAVAQVGSAEQHLASGAFAQINPGAAARLYARVAEVAKAKGHKVLDLYSGSGGISLTIASHGAKQVLGIERTPKAVEAARLAASGLGDQVQFIEASAEHLKSAMQSSGFLNPSEPGGGFPVWIVNPPRRGLAPSVINQLLELKPRLVVYVSCHPDRLARDIKSLETAYTLQTVSPVDMFPQTRHIETIVSLSAKAN